MKKLRTLIFCLCLFPICTSAQIKEYYLSFTGGGTGISGSLDVGVLIHETIRSKIIAQTGVGFGPSATTARNVLNIPTQILCNFGIRSFFIETGVGFTYTSKEKSHIPELPPQGAKTYIGPIIGFRHQTNRLFARLYFSPLAVASGKELYNKTTKDFIKFGISLGFRFTSQ